MEIITRLAKIMLILIVSVILITSLSCSDDPSSPKKEDEGTIPQDAVTIGVEGGTIEKDDITVTIPEGAFTENHDISVSEVDDDGAFGENSISKSYKINGLPSEYNKPIAIKSNYSGQLNGDSFLAIGQMVKDEIRNDSSVVYGLFTAIDSSGLLTSSLPAVSGPNINKLDNKPVDLGTLELFVKFLDSYTYKETNHFIIFFPLSAIQHFSKVEEIFEGAYAVVKHELRINEEITRTVVITSQNRPIYVNEEVFNQQYLVHRFSISQESLGNQQYNEILVRAVQELFNFTGSNNPFRSIHWTSSAIYYWIEDWISDAPEYKFPEDFLRNGMSPFLGFNIDDIEDYVGHRHGIGMSSLIKYLKELEGYGLTGLSNFLHNNESHISQSTELLESVETPFNQWWPDFFKQLINNELFELPNDYFISRAHAEWNINNENDTLKVFTSSEVGNYQDLSAKIFKFNLNYSGLDTSQNLIFNLSNLDNNTDLALLLFSVKDGKPNYLQTSNSKNLKIEDIKSFIENYGKQILAVVVNNDITTENFLGQSNIEFKIEISSKKQSQIFDFNRCHIEVQFIAEIERGNNFGSSFETKLQSLGSSQMRGSIVENIYTGVFNYSDETKTLEYSLKVELNETQDTIKTFIWEAKQTGPEEGMLTEQEIRGINIPLSNDDPNKFELSGSDICSKILTIKYDYYHEEQFVKISEYTCDSESYIFLHFYKD